MKKLDTSPIAPGNAFPVKGGTLLFLQLAYQEAFAVLMQANIGSTYDPTKGYILYGCINTGSGSTYNISAGAVFFNGEIYLVDAVSFTLTGSNVAEGVIGTTQYTADADPVLFTGGSSLNVHNIRKIVFQNGLAGSGAFDFVNAINLALRPVGGIGQTVMWSLPSGAITDYFNTSTGAGIHALTSGWEIDPDMGGTFAAGYLNGDASFGALGNTGGGSVTIEAENVPELESEQSFQDTDGGTENAFGSTMVSTTKRTVTVNTGSPNTALEIVPKYVVKLFIKRIS